MAAPVAWVTCSAFWTVSLRSWLGTALSNAVRSALVCIADRRVRGNELDRGVGECAMVPASLRHCLLALTRNPGDSALHFYWAVPNLASAQVKEKAECLTLF